MNKHKNLAFETHNFREEANNNAARMLHQKFQQGAIRVEVERISHPIMVDEIFVEKLEL